MPTDAQTLQGSARPTRIFLLGATGTIGRATAAALVERGHEVICFVRPRPGGNGQNPAAAMAAMLPGTDLRFGDVTNAESLVRDGFRGEHFDVLVSCLASRTGTPKDAWAIDHKANSLALQAAKEAGVTQIVLLSAICVQRPLLAFQQAKLAMEAEVMQSGLIWSIVRPTAFFKSLSGQIGRLKAGKPFLVFGNGQLTACKPISDRDLGHYLAGCIDDETRHGRILPIGGPEPAITPIEQGEMLFTLLGMEPKYRHVPLGLIVFIRRALGLLGRFSPTLADKGELAAIGHYYASQSMLVLDPVTGRYDADATPSTGSDTLADHYRRLIAGEISDDRGDHAVF